MLREEGEREGKIEDGEGRFEEVRKEMKEGREKGGIKKEELEEMDERRWKEE